MPIRFELFFRIDRKATSLKLKKRRVPSRRPILLSAAVVLRRETMAALSMSAASISFGRNVASTQGLRVTAVRARAFLASRLRTANPRDSSLRFTFIHFPGLDVAGCAPRTASDVRLPPRVTGAL